MLYLNMNFKKINNNIIEYYKNDALASSSIEKNKYWNPHILKFVNIYMTMYNIENIIDVGSNIGINTIYYSELIKNKGIIFAYEGQKQNYELLKKNVENNKIRNILMYNLVCDCVEVKVKMPILNTNENINMGDITPNIMIINTIGYNEIETVILDNIKFPKISIMIIDVQGWEINVLNGSLNLIDKYKPLIIIEIEDYQLSKNSKKSSDLINKLKEMNYYIYYLQYTYPSTHICIHNEQLDEFNNKFKKYIYKNNEENNINYNMSNGIDQKIILDYKLFFD